MIEMLVLIVYWMQETECDLTQTSVELDSESTKTESMTNLLHASKFSGIKNCDHSIE